MSNIGICISTCDRPDYLSGLLESLEGCPHDICICDDGNIKVNQEHDHIEYITSEEPRSGVAKNKNNGLRYLIDAGCEYFFCLEDDCTITDMKVFDMYVDASRKTGIQHFNFGPGSPWNRKQDDPSIIGNLAKRTLATQSGEPVPKAIIDYGEVSISLFTHVVGMLSFFTKQCLDTVGLFDEQYYNAWEHVDHTLQIINNDMHPPFWHFADITGSEKYIKEQLNEKANSSLSKTEDEFNELVIAGADRFQKKNGRFPGKIPAEDISTVKEKLRNIYKEFSSEA